MVVVKQFAAEFKIKLVAELTDSFTDVFSLHFQIFVIIKTYFHLSDFLSSLIFQFTGNSILQLYVHWQYPMRCFFDGIFVISQLIYMVFLFIIKK